MNFDFAGVNQVCPVGETSFVAAFTNRCPDKIDGKAFEEKHKWDDRQDRQRMSCYTTAAQRSTPPQTASPRGYDTSSGSHRQESGDNVLENSRLWRRGDQRARLKSPCLQRKEAWASRGLLGCGHGIRGKLDAMRKLPSWWEPWSHNQHNGTTATFFAAGSPQGRGELVCRNGPTQTPECNYDEPGDHLKGKMEVPDSFRRIPTAEKLSMTDPAYARATRFGMKLTSPGST